MISESEKSYPSRNLLPGCSSTPRNHRPSAPASDSSGRFGVETDAAAILVAEKAVFAAKSAGAGLVDRVWNSCVLWLGRTLAGVTLSPPAKSQRRGHDFTTSHTV